MSSGDRLNPAAPPRGRYIRAEHVDIVVAIDLSASHMARLRFAEHLVVRPYTGLFPLPLSGTVAGYAALWLNLMPAKEWISAYPQLNVPSWLDFYASSDPVPNGPLFSAERSQVVYNRSSFFTDHISYWRNLDDFVARLICALSRVGGSPLDGGDNGQIFTTGYKNRAHRVKWLGWSRKLIYMALCIVVFGPYVFPPASDTLSLDNVGRAAFHGYEGISSELSADGSDDKGREVAQHATIKFRRYGESDFYEALGLCVFVGVATLWYHFIYLIWVAWESVSLQTLKAKTALRPGVNVSAAANLVRIDDDMQQMVDLVAKGCEEAIQLI